jgi:hypothetical protein
MRAEKEGVDSSGLAAKGGRLSMAQFGLWRFLSQGWMDREGLWKKTGLSLLQRKSVRAIAPQLLFRAVIRFRYLGN